MKSVIEFSLKALVVTVSAATLFVSGSIVGIVSYVLAEDDNAISQGKTKYDNNTQLKS